MSFALLAKLGFGQPAVAGQLHVADPGRIAGGDIEIEIDQRVFPVDDRGRGDLSPVIAIVLERGAELRLRRAALLSE